MLNSRNRNWSLRNMFLWKMILICFILFLTNLSYAQLPEDTYYIDNLGRRCYLANASYKRTYKEEIIVHPNYMETTVYHVKDYYLTGELYMEARCTGVLGYLGFEGPCVYYYRNGKKRMEGTFVNGKMADDWKYYSQEGKDLSLEPLEIDTSYHVHNPKDSIGLIDAEFPGGEEELKEYFRTHMGYPQEMEQRSISGKVVVLFVIDTTGEVSRIIFKNRIAYALEAEVRRAISFMPAWQPAVYKGKKVRVYKSIPIRF